MSIEEASPDSSEPKETRSAAVKAYEEAHDASKQYPHVTLALAFFLGFVFGVYVAVRR
jgi:hypothetical protein